jgi:hypothetical protein
MSYKTAQVLGALLAILLVGGVLLIGRSLPPPCHGALRLELRPPLKGPGPFVFALDTFDAEAVAPTQHCEFEVRLDKEATITRKQCAYPWQLQLRGSPGPIAITGLLLGVTPARLALSIRDPHEALFDTTLTPNYANGMVALRPEGGEERFCGSSALLKVPCVEGSAQCTPFHALCDGPEDCPAGKVCCAAPAWGLEYGAANAMECSSRATCVARIESFVACHSDEHCVKPDVCADDPAGRSFTPVLRLCVPKR